MSVSKIFISCLVNFRAGSARRAARSAHAQQRVLPALHFVSFGACGGAKVVVLGRFFFVIYTLKSSQTISEMADCVANESEK